MTRHNLRKFKTARYHRSRFVGTPQGSWITEDRDQQIMAEGRPSDAELAKKFGCTVNASRRRNKLRERVRKAEEEARERQKEINRRKIEILKQHFLARAKKKAD